MAGSDFERLVIRGYKEKEESNWPTDKEIHVAGVR
jgi:hypothetical protein